MGLLCWRHLSELILTAGGSDSYDPYAVEIH
jgi:hypothetical protein